jgi:hypothetical protein
MRGRARKSKSKFIVVCNSTKEKEDLEDLLKPKCFKAGY